MAEILRAENTGRTPVGWLAPECDGLRSVVAATMDDAGMLLQANAGLMRSLPAPLAHADAVNLSTWFIQPDFLMLKSSVTNAGGKPYVGLLNVGVQAENAQTLRGRFWREGTHWRLLAEHDIDALERQCNKVMEINQDYAFAQTQLAQLNIKLQQREAQVVAMSVTDPLTGVGNRRRLEQGLGLEITRASRSNEMLCAIMCDIDLFKKVNDQYGHDVGDKVLISVAQILQTQVRPTDIVARFGGEEFVVLLPGNDIGRALEVAERIRCTIAKTAVPPMHEPVTASFGVAQLREREDGSALLKRIDNALYAAKQAGRNRVQQG